MIQENPMNIVQEQLLGLESIKCGQCERESKSAGQHCHWLGGLPIAASTSTFCPLTHSLVTCNRHEHVKTICWGWHIDKQSWTLEKDTTTSIHAMLSWTWPSDLGFGDQKDSWAGVQGQAGCPNWEVSNPQEQKSMCLEVMDASQFRKPLHLLMVLRTIIGQSRPSSPIFLGSSIPR